MPLSAGSATYDTLALTINGLPCATSTAQLTSTATASASSTTTTTEVATTTATATATTTDPCAAYVFEHNYAYTANREITIGGLAGAVNITATLLLNGNAVQTGTGAVEIIANQTVPLTINLNQTGATGTGSVQVTIVEAGSTTPSVILTGTSSGTAIGSTSVVTLPDPTTTATVTVIGTGTSGVTTILPPPTGTTTTTVANDICGSAINTSWTATTGQAAFMCVLTVPGGATYRERVPNTTLGAEAVTAEFCSQGGHMSESAFTTSFGCVADGIF